ncbi:MAG: hypothetical protein ACYC7E_15270 [Armatimonadota bacterium]
MHRFAVFFVLLALCATAMRPSIAGTQTIVLRELLNQRYTNELVSFQYAPKDSEVLMPGTLQVTSPQGLIASQIFDIVYLPDGKTVKSARLSFIIEKLEPLATHRYTINQHPAGIELLPPPATDLKVTIAPGRDSVEIVTTKLGARFPLCGEDFEEPVPVGQIPGPLAGMRFGDGPWGGDSRLTGTVRVKSFTAKLTARGPVFARVDFRYEFVDGNVLTLSAQVTAGDSAVLWEMAVQDDRPNQGVEFTLGQLPGVKEAVLPKGIGSWYKDRTKPITPSNEPFAFLSPNTSIGGALDSPWHIRLTGANGQQWGLRSRDAGAWVDPIPFTYAGFKTWNLDMIPRMWEVWKRKRLPVTYSADGTVTISASLAAGRRLWSIGADAPVVGERLNVIKEMILDWPLNLNEQHPHLFISKTEQQAAWQRMTIDPARLNFLTAVKGYWGWANEGYLYSGGKAEIAAKAEVVKSLRDALGMLGNFDSMRNGVAVAAMYDALIGTDLITTQERPLLRAQLAYLAYQMAGPELWSPERGYISGNPNMSVSYVLSQGILACLLSDHPLARQWTDHASGWMERWLSDEVGPKGEWIPEGAHYGGQVSLTPIVAYAIAARRADFADYVNDPRLKRAVLFYAKQFTPRDPQRKDRRLSPPVGRGLSGEDAAVFGIMAKATAQSDPAYSKLMQWMWRESGYGPMFGDWRMGGFEPLYLDRTLPVDAPKWDSELFPTLGVVLRAGVGTPAEHYLNILTNVDSLRNLDVWTPGVGSIAKWFAFGKPLSEAFTFATGYHERHELLRDGVLPARNWGAPGDAKTPFGYYTETQFGSFATMPRLDYVRSAFHITKVDDRDWFPPNMPAWPKVKGATAPKLAWTRQALFVKDIGAQGVHYLVLRDTTRGGQPTMWQFWSLSEKIGLPEQAQAADFLADKLGNSTFPARELPAGDRYTAIGQCGVDIEYFIASPVGTPRSTLRYGGMAQQSVPEYQDLLHLQSPGDGAYYVVLFPRLSGETPPVFTTLGGGKVIKITGKFGTDYVFLAEEATEVRVDGITFKGTAGSVQMRAGQTILAIGAPGVIRYRDYTLDSPAAATMYIDPDAVHVELAVSSAG